MSTPTLGFNDISAFSAVLPTIAGSITWRFQSVALRLLVVLSAISLVTDLIGTVAIWWYGSNMTASNIYILLQSLVAGLIFINLKEFNPSLRSFLRITFWTLCLASLTLFLSGPIGDSINKWLLTTSSFFIMVFSFLYFYNLVRYELKVELWRIPSFYVVAGLMLYHVSNAALFLTIDSLQPEVISDLWQFKLTGYIALNVLFTVAFILEYKQVHV